MNPFAVVTAGIQAVSSFFSKKQDLKAARQSAEAKLLQKKQDHNTTIELTDAEWESLSVQTQNNSWKDEYITLIMTSPIVAIIFGSLYTVIDAEVGNAIVNAATSGIGELVALGMDFGLIVSGVVFAAIGLKLWRA